MLGFLLQPLRLVSGLLLTVDFLPFIPAKRFQSLPRAFRGSRESGLSVACIPMATLSLHYQRERGEREGGVEWDMKVFLENHTFRSKETALISVLMFRYEIPTMSVAISTRNRCQ